MNQQYLNLNCGNKGQMFTVDALIAGILTLIILTLGIHYATLSPEESLTGLQMTRTASDLLFVLDKTDILDLNAATITNEITSLMSNNYDMHFKITTLNGDAKEGGNPIPEDRFITSTKKIFVMADSTVDDFGIIQIWMWLK